MVRTFALIAVTVLAGVLVYSSIHVSEDANSPQRGSAAVPDSAETSYGPVVLSGFTCSTKEVAQLKRLAPVDTVGQLQEDAEALEAKQRELDDLKTQIDILPTTNFSGPSQLDYRLHMVDQYNTLLGSYQNDSAELNRRKNAFNAQADAYQHFLELHCKRTEE